MFNPYSQLATGAVECSKVDEVIDIDSVVYSYFNISCHLECLKDSHPTFLDGTNIVCQNENKTRSLCDARNNCNFTSDTAIRVPDTTCVKLFNRPSHIKILYRCINTGW